jgi:hypothetical protein
VLLDVLQAQYMYHASAGSNTTESLGSCGRLLQFLSSLGSEGVIGMTVLCTVVLDVANNRLMPISRPSRAAQKLLNKQELYPALLKMLSSSIRCCDPDPRDPTLLDEMRDTRPEDAAVVLEACRSFAEEEARMKNSRYVQDRE